jgi:hypothetical protein
MKARILAALAGSVLLAVGCVSAPTPDPLPHTGDPVADFKAAAVRGPAKDKMLWQYRAAVAAMRRARFAEAREILDDAILSLGGIFGKDPDARKARGLFHGESRKRFLGEPYERVMAYYYRGILYWMDGEPDNARACFRSAQIIDSDTEHKEYAADYALLDYLDGLVTAKLGGDGSDAWKRAKSSSKLEDPPPYDTKANVLFFLEYGTAPFKHATGRYGEELRFREGPPGTRAAQVRLDGQTLRARPYDDLFFQATTRGGRVMDHILANKAVFKSTTDTVGDAAIVAGIVMANQRGTRSGLDEAGVGLALFGLVSKIASASANPTADTRCWDNLPQFLSFAAAQCSTGKHTATVEFQNASGVILASLSRTVSFEVVPSGRDIVIFVSDR